MIEKTNTIVDVKHTKEEDFEFWQGFDSQNREVEYASKRSRIKKTYNEEGDLFSLEINGEEVYNLANVPTFPPETEAESK